MSKYASSYCNKLAKLLLSCEMSATSRSSINCVETLVLSLIYFIASFMHDVTSIMACVNTDYALMPNIVFDVGDFIDRFQKLASV